MLIGTTELLTATVAKGQGITNFRFTTWIVGFNTADTGTGMFTNDQDIAIADSDIEAIATNYFTATGVGTMTLALNYHYEEQAMPGGTNANVACDRFDIVAEGTSSATCSDDDDCTSFCLEMCSNPTHASCQTAEMACSCGCY